MPKKQHVVKHGPVWTALVAELGNPLADGPASTGPPTFDRTDDAYGPWFDDADFALPGRHGGLGGDDGDGDGDDVPSGPALTETLPVTVPDAPPDVPDVPDAPPAAGRKRKSTQKEEDK